MTHEEQQEPQRSEIVLLGTVATSGPAEIVAQATDVATALADVINKRGLYKEIQGRKYVLVEGWSTLGGMIGILPREVSVNRLADGSFEAVVELIRTSDGMVVGRASALCGMDESTWASRPDYARRSMAVTRATGKAYRLGFSWIIKLAGYEPTPAEEMSDIVEGHVVERPTPSKPTAKIERPLVPDTLRSYIAKKAAGYGSGARASQAQMGLAQGMLEACFGGNEKSREMRHSVLAYFFGDWKETSQLQPAQALALLDWLHPEKDEDEGYLPDPIAVSEAQAVLKARIKQLGQKDLFGTE